MKRFFCKHLEQYGQLYEQVEDSYRQCVNLMDRLVIDKTEVGLVDELKEALQNWMNENRELREMFAELAAEGKLDLPEKPELATQCKICRASVPRLIFSEWDFLDNGQVTYRGNQLPIAERAHV
jgi:hypothetical protein